MTELPVIITAILTIVSPLLTAIFTRVEMSGTTKNNIAVGVSFLIAGVYVVLNGGVQDWSDMTAVLSVVPVVYTVQQLIFANLMKGLAVKVEGKVGVGSGSAEIAEPEEIVETPAKG